MTQNEEEHLYLQYIDKLSNEIEKIKNDNKPLDFSDIINILPTLMQIVESYKTKSGEHKKKIVIHSIENFIDSNYNIDSAESFKLVIRSNLPTLIDTLIKIDRKELRIKMKKYQILKCCV